MSQAYKLYQPQSFFFFPPLLHTNFFSTFCQPSRYKQDPQIFSPWLVCTWEMSSRLRVTQLLPFLAPKIIFKVTNHQHSTSHSKQFQFKIIKTEKERKKRKGFKLNLHCKAQGQYNLQGIKMSNLSNFIQSSEVFKSVDKFHSASCAFWLTETVERREVLHMI